jgi:hypothetical protein
MITGKPADLNIFLILSSTLVFVIAAIRFAPEEVGAQRSPKYIPAIIAPAVTVTSAPPLLAIIIRTIPIDAAVPMLEPIRSDMKHDRIYADRIKKRASIEEIP